METILFLVIVLSISLIHIPSGSNGISNPCENWDRIRGDKCYKVLESQVLDFEGSVKICTSLSSSATLVTIETKEEQDFLNDFLFKNRSIVQSVWIGAKTNDFSSPGNEFVWDNNSKMTFTNWDSQNHFRAGYDCVEIQSDVSDNLKLGKWLSVPCKKRNVVLCQINNSKQVIPNNDLQKNLTEFQKEVRDFMASTKKFTTVVNEFMQTSSLDLIPVGFIYIQLPNQTEPKLLWPKYEWIETSRQYSGLFFRVFGIGSDAFGAIQKDTSPIISEIESSKSSCSSHISNLKVGDWSGWIRSGGSESGNECLRFKMSSEEVRPINTAIRLWKRAR